MEVLVRNAVGNLTERDREYAAKKLGRLDRYFNAAQRVEIVHREEKLAHRIEITVFADGLTLRGEDSEETVAAAIDVVADKMENRLRRLKTRLVKSHRQRGNRVPMGLEDIEESDPEETVHIREHKRFVLKPMSIEEASLQLEMLDHPFFVFRNEETSQTEVLYKRAKGGYGLLSPEM